LNHMKLFKGIREMLEDDVKHSSDCCKDRCVSEPVEKQKWAHTCAFKDGGYAKQPGDSRGNGKFNSAVQKNF
jgi:hypothetical protein